MAGPDEQQGGVPGQVSDQEWLQNYLSEHQGQVEAGARISPPMKKKKPELLMLLAGALILAAAAAAVMMTKSPAGKSSDKKEAHGDLGQGVVIASGLRGHLVTELLGQTVHYKLKMEPIALPEQDAFWRATSSNKEPYFFNVRVLDAVGDPICGKQIVLPALGVNTVANGTDPFVRVKNDKGVIDGLWVEGSLPCSPDQFARFGYWDFTTNFPTVVDLDRLYGIDHRADTDGTPTKTDVAKSKEAATAAAAAAKRRAAQNRPKLQAGFFLQGDDHISSFEPGRNILTVGPGRSFVVLRAGDLATASAWADDAALVHYICDQQATCSLHRSGSAATIIARRIN
ncbi:MAG TPA: hypothetical protein VN151_01510 [Terracidiphilus sp.]|nr:hypothetical protein [Terracidiphilus sp.]